MHFFPPGTTGPNHAPPSCVAGELNTGARRTRERQGRRSAISWPVSSRGPPKRGDGSHRRGGTGEGASRRNLGRKQYIPLSERCCGNLPLLGHIFTCLFCSNSVCSADINPRRKKTLILPREQAAHYTNVLSTHVPEMIHVSSSRPKNHTNPHTLSDIGALICSPSPVPR